MRGHMFQKNVYCIIVSRIVELSLQSSFQLTLIYMYYYYKSKSIFINNVNVIIVIVKLDCTFFELSRPLYVKFLKYEKRIRAEQRPTECWRINAAERGSLMTSAIRRPTVRPPSSKSLPSHSIPDVLMTKGTKFKPAMMLSNTIISDVISSATANEEIWWR